MAAEPPSPDRPTDRFRILAVDGGGMRGLIPALVIAELERRLREATGVERRIADCFHLLSGTSTGGLVALTLATPDPRDPARPRFSGDDLVRLYDRDGPRIFGWGPQRLLSLGGLVGPKYSSGPLRRAVEGRLGSVTMSHALRDVVVTSYDMRGREPFFFKRWRAREAADRDVPMVDAALATSAAPTYLPSHGLRRPSPGQDETTAALVDGGVFANNPTVAAVVEALKRSTDQPVPRGPDDLLVVSLGTGSHEAGFEQRRVRRWGKLGWIWPRGGGPPLLDAVLDGASDAASHWAHILLNSKPGDGPPAAAEIGRGPRYFRLQATLPEAIAMDDPSAGTRARLQDAAKRLIADEGPILGELVERLAPLDPIPPDPPDSPAERARG